MVVDDGPLHIATKDHMALVLRFNLMAVASRLEKLTVLYSTPGKESITTLPLDAIHLENQRCGFQGFRHVCVENGKHMGNWSYPSFASPPMIQTQVDSAQVAPKPPGAIAILATPTPWICEICKLMMHEVSKPDHLAEKSIEKS